MSLLVSPLKLRELGILGMNNRNIGFIGRYNQRKNYCLADNKLKPKVPLSLAVFQSLS